MRTHPACFSVVVAMAGLFCCGCGKNTTSAPISLPEDQIPALISQAFNNSDKETQDQANQYINNMRTRDYGAAFDIIHDLIRKPGLTADQRALVGRAFRTTSEKLQEAAAGGDEHANQILNSYSATK